MLLGPPPQLRIEWPGGLSLASPVPERTMKHLMKASLISPSAVTAAAVLALSPASAQTSPEPPSAMKPPPTNESPLVAESPASKAPDRLASIQAEVESFIKSVYRDMEQDDPARVLTSFADTVDYYSYGPQNKAAIAEQLRKYFAAFPTRTFTVGEVTLQGASPKSRKITATFEVRYTLKDAQGTTSTGHSKAELDLVKPDKVIKIVRFNGTSFPDNP